jgi:hypothetical protein
MVHVNVVEGTALGLVMEMLVVCPLQIAASAAKAFGILFTVSVAEALGNELHVPVTITLYALPLNVLGTLLMVRVAVVAPL